MPRNEDNVTRGPARWQRAALNAIKRPNSSAAELYFSRYSIARDISRSVVGVNGKDQAFRRMQRRWDRDAGAYLFQKSYVTCSVFCTILQLALDENSVDPDRLLRAFKAPEKGTEDDFPWGYVLWGYVRPLEPGELSCPVRCQVCGRRT